MSSDEFIEVESETIDSDKYENIKKKVINDPNHRDFLIFYDKLRAKFAGNKKENKSKLKDFLFLLPDFFILLIRLMLDKRVDKKTKTFITGIIAYVLLPIDLIPDFIPVIGFIDDLIIVVLGLNQVINEVDEDVILSNWSGEENFISVLKKILSLISKDSSLIKKIKQFLRTDRSKV